MQLKNNVRIRNPLSMLDKGCILSGDMKSKQGGHGDLQGGVALAPI